MREGGGRWDRCEKMEESYQNNRHLFFLLQSHTFIITILQYITLIHLSLPRPFFVFFIALSQRKNPS